MEEKKTKTKSGTKKTTSTKKKTTTSVTKASTKATPKKSSATKETTKKTTTPKKVVKKTPPKKITTPKEEKLEEKKTTSESLEKTIIFDGNQSKNILEVVDKLEEENVCLDDKVIKRSKIKKYIIIILTILIFVVIGSTIGYIVNTHIKEKENNQTLNSNIYKKVNANYKTINDIEENKDSSLTEDEYENIEDITLAEFEKKNYNKENMTIFISSTTCYHSITFESVIDKVYGSLDKKIYRINITSLTDEEIERFRTYYAFKVTPTIFTIKDGIVTSEVTGTMTEEELTTWAKENSI